jgi:hypothetical protein
MSKLRTYLAISLAIVACVGCNSHAYNREAMQYHALAQAVLISRGICSSEQDCQKKHLLFAEGGEVSLGPVHWGGAYITLYEINDMALVEDVVARFKQLHASLKVPKVKLSVYSSKHLESKVEFSEVTIQ